MHTLGGPWHPQDPGCYPPCSYGRPVSHPTGGVAQFEVPVPKLRKTGKRCGIAVVNKVCVLCQYFHVSFKN